MNRPTSALKQEPLNYEKQSCSRFVQNMIHAGHVEQIPCRKLVRFDGGACHSIVFPVQYLVK